MIGRLGECQVKIFDYSHTAAPDYYSEHRHTLLMLRPVGPLAVQLPDLAVTPGHYLERYLLAEYQPVDLTSESSAAGDSRLYAQDAAAARKFFSEWLAPLVRQYPGIYLEIRDNALLLFHPGREQETVGEIETMLALTTQMCARCLSEENR